MKINNSREFEIEKDSQDLTYVLFKDEWCSLCRDVEYILKEIMHHDVPVYAINIAKNTDLVEKYSIAEIPTVVVFRKGRIIDFIESKNSKVKYLSHLKLFSIIK